ncbi:MAG: hypothetical protein H7Y10_12130 [Flavobacterium sp.]|nr:hypothetical protein [Flavobacterium sp.]
MGKPQTHSFKRGNDGLCRTVKTPAPQFQEVKVQAILIASISLETSTKELMETMKIQGHYANFWFDNSGQRISEVDLLTQNPEAFPLRLWRFASKRDIDRESETGFLSDL